MERDSREREREDPSEKREISAAGMKKRREAPVCAFVHPSKKI